MKNISKNVCANCGETLDRHNVTARCRECKLINRNERITGTTGSREPVILADAIALVMAELGAKQINDTGENP